MATTTKPKTAVEGNAPGGPDFEGAAIASGEKAVAGAQVRPETQLREDDGNRTLAKPVVDPGPVLANGETWRHPDTSKGETIRSVNEPVKILQRTSTAPDWSRLENTSEVNMNPDNLGYHSLASDIYNKEKGEGLTDMAKKHADEERELAPQAD